MVSARIAGVASAKMSLALVERSSGDASTVPSCGWLRIGKAKPEQPSAIAPALLYLLHPCSRHPPYVPLLRHALWAGSAVRFGILPSQSAPSPLCPVGTPGGRRNSKSQTQVQAAPQPAVLNPVRPDRRPRSGLLSKGAAVTLVRRPARGCVQCPERRNDGVTLAGRRFAMLRWRHAGHRRRVFTSPETIRVFQKRRAES